MEPIPLPPVNDHPGPIGLWLLHHLTHQHWIHYQDLYLATNPTLAHMTTWCLLLLPSRPLFWSLQEIFPGYFSPTVLPWWKIWFPIHLNSCGSPWWMVYFPFWTLNPSLLFQASLDTHKKENPESNMGLVYPSIELYRAPLFWIIIYGLHRTFLLTSTVYLLTQCLLCQTNSWDRICCAAPCFWVSYQRPGR